MLALNFEEAYKEFLKGKTIKNGLHGYTFCLVKKRGCKEIIINDGEVNMVVDFEDPIFSLNDLHSFWQVVEC